MTETTRTTVTLSKFNMSLVEDLIGILGNTRAQVISTLVERYLQNEQNIALIEKLKAIKRQKELEATEQKAKNPEVIDKKIKNLVVNAKTITIESFLDYLKIDNEFFYNHLPEWKEKYGISVENKRIIFS
jgi:hypothetical protein